MSGPICLILHQGISHSFSFPRKPQSFSLVVVSNARIQPFFGSKTRSDTQPRRLQSWIINHIFFTQFAESHEMLLEESFLNYFMQ